MEIPPSAPLEVKNEERKRKEKKRKEKKRKEKKGNNGKERKKRKKKLLGPLLISTANPKSINLISPSIDNIMFKSFKSL